MEMKRVWVRCWGMISHASTAPAISDPPPGYIHPGSAHPAVSRPLCGDPSNAHISCSHLRTEQISTRISSSLVESSPFQPPISPVPVQDLTSVWPSCSQAFLTQPAADCVRRHLSIMCSNRLSSCIHRWLKSVPGVSHMDMAILHGSGHPRSTRTRPVIGFPRRSHSSPQPPYCGDIAPQAPSHSAGIQSLIQKTACLLSLEGGQARHGSFQSIQSLCLRTPIT